jgi:hypothetical protein
MNLPMNARGPADATRGPLQHDRAADPPWNVLDAVLELLGKVRREDFVPPASRLAFGHGIPLGVAGQTMLRPRSKRACCKTWPSAHRPRAGNRHRLRLHAPPCWASWPRKW